MIRKFTVLVEKDEDGMLVGKVPALNGCHTQAKTMPELLKRIKEPIKMYLEVKRVRHGKLSYSKFIGV